MRGFQVGFQPLSFANCQNEHHNLFVDHAINQTMAGFVVLDFVAVAQSMMKSLVQNVRLLKAFSRLLLQRLPNALVSRLPFLQCIGLESEFETHLKLVDVDAD